MNYPINMAFQFAREIEQAEVWGAGPVLQLLRHADLTSADRARWAALSAHAGAANVFAQDWFMDAALRHTAGQSEPLLAVVSEPQGPWLGVMPLIAEPRFGRWPVPIWRNWLATNQFLGTPLVARHAVDRFWECLLQSLDERAGSEVLFQFAQFAPDDPINAALIDHCGRTGRAFRTIDQFARPAYLPRGDTDWEPSGKTRRRLNSLWRRIERDIGPISIDLLDSRQPCDVWIDDFLELEVTGWKGLKRSALACDTGNAAFFRSVIERGHANGSARLARLQAGGRTLAMSSWFESGKRGYGFKMAFDEHYRDYAPGQLLMREIVSRIGAVEGMIFDTCTSQNASCYRQFWPDERIIADAAIAIGLPRQRFKFSALMKARAAYEAVKGISAQGGKDKRGI